MKRGALSRRAITAAVVAVACLATAALASVQAIKTPVRARKGVGEYQPARGGDWFAWEQNRRARPDHYNAYVKRDGGRRIKLNADGTQGALGGISGRWVVYQQFDGNRSTIRYFNVETRKRSRPPIFVNTRRWEYWPSMSGDWILFGRRDLNGRNRKVILYNRAQERHRVLDKTVSSDAFIAPGQVSGNYAVWYRCKVERSCNVYLYDIELGLARQIRNPRRKDQHAPSVTADGTIYFARGGSRCGRRAKLMRFRRGDMTTLLRFRKGVDVGDSYAATDADGNTEVYFEQNRCGTRAGSDIYKIVD